jgi:hypothetical protein
MLVVLRDLEVLREQNNDRTHHDQAFPSRRKAPRETVGDKDEATFGKLVAWGVFFF